MIRDFTPTAETISLHGLGFIQLKLPANRRLHVWHPDLPRRACFEWSAVHNHRFSFTSRVLVGRQCNRRWMTSSADAAPEICTHDLISHDGPRGPTGGRLSYVNGMVRALPFEVEEYGVGQVYFMPKLEYHDTPNSGIVITIMEKLDEGTVHASSLIERGHIFDQGFDRFQLSPDDLWSYVRDAFEQGAL